MVSVFGHSETRALGFTTSAMYRFISVKEKQLASKEWDGNKEPKQNEIPH